MMNRVEIEKTVEPIPFASVFGSLVTLPVLERHSRSLQGQPSIHFAQVSGGFLFSFPSYNLPQALSLGAKDWSWAVATVFFFFPIAVFYPGVRWTGVEHPARRYFNRPDFQQAIRDYKCQLVGVDFVREPLPFPDQHFSMITFSETFGHLPVERLNFVLGKLAEFSAQAAANRFVSRTQASLENRIRLFKGSSIIDLPKHYEVAKGIFGHIRLHTPAEMSLLMCEQWVSLVRSVLESNNSADRGNSSNSLHRTLYRFV